MNISNLRGVGSGVGSVGKIYIHFIHRYLHSANN